MKRWCKLSLVGLIVPTAVASTVLTTVGCNSPVKILSPKIKDNPEINGPHKTINEWWNSFRDVRSRVDALNNTIFTNQTKLFHNQVMKVELVPSTRICFRVTLAENHVFSETGSNTWTSDAKVNIRYVQKNRIGIPAAKTQISDVDTLDNWVKKINQSARDISRFNFGNLFDNNVLNSTNTASIKAIITDASAGKVQILVTLKTGYLFNSNRQIGTFFVKYVKKDVQVSLPVMNQLHIGKETIHEWVNAKKTKVADITNFNFKELFANLALNKTNTQAIELNVTNDDKFIVKVTLKLGHAFDANGKREWISNPQTYHCEIAEPIYVGPTLVNSQDSIVTKWKSLKDSTNKQEKLVELNKLLSPKTQLSSEAVESVNITIADKISFEAKLKTGFLFTGGKNVWRCEIPTKVYTTVGQPDVKTNFVGTTSLVEWIKLQNKQPLGTKLTTFFTNNVLNETNTNDVRIEQLPTDETKFTVTPILNTGHAFTNGQSAWKSVPLAYSIQSKDPKFAVINIISEENDVEDWWDTIYDEDDMERVVGEFNRLLTPDTQLDASKVKSIDLIQTAPIKFKVTFFDGNVFSNGSTSWISEALLKYFIKVEQPEINAKFQTRESLDTWIEQQNKKLADLNTYDFKQLFSNDALNIENTRSISLSKRGNDSFTIHVVLNTGYMTAESRMNIFIESIPYYTEIATPKLLPNVAVNELLPNPAAWWASFREKPQRVSKFNEFVTTDTKLKLEQVEDVEIKQLSTDKFQFMVSFAESHVLNNGDTKWISDVINFNAMTQVAKPVLSKDAALIDMKWLKIGDFIEVMKPKTQSIICLNELLTQQTRLAFDQVHDISLKGFNGESNNQKEIEFTLTLNDRYSFPDGSKKWISPRISYVCKQEVKLPTTLVSYHSAKDMRTWIDGINEQAKKLDTFDFKKLFNNDSLNAENTEKIVLTQKQNNQFTIAATLRPRFGIQNQPSILDSSWVSGNLNYTVANVIPKLIENPVLFGRHKNVGDWWKSLPNHATRVKELNKVLTGETQQKSSAVKDVSLVHNDTSNKIGLNTLLATNEIYENNQNVWFSELTIKYTQIIDDPVIKSTDNVIQGYQAKAHLWWESLLILEDEIKELNAVFTPETQLSTEFVEEIKTEKVDNFTLIPLIKLKPNFCWTNGTRLLKTAPIKYAPAREVSTPVITNYVIKGSEKNLESWWEVKNSDTKAIVHELNKLISPETQLNPNDVQDVRMLNNENPQFEVILNPFVVNKNGDRRFIISGGTNVIEYVSQNPTEKNTSSNIDYPKIRKIRSSDSLETWVANENHKSLEEKITDLNVNGYLTTANTESIEVVSQSGKVIVKATLKTNTNFPNGQRTWSSEPIVYIEVVEQPKNFPITLNGNVNQTTEQYINRYEQLSVDQRVRYFFISSEEANKFADKVAELKIKEVGKNLFGWECVLKQNFEFPDGSRVMKSIKSIPYSWVYPLPEIKSGLAVGSAKAFVEQLQTKGLEEKIKTLFKNTENNQLNPLGIADVSVTAVNNEVIVKMKLNALFGGQNTFKYQNVNPNVSDSNTTWTSTITFPSA